MQRLIVVSNRVASPEAGKASSGGLAVGVSGMLARAGGVWVGWSGRVTEGQSGAMEVVSTVSRDVSYATIDLSREDHDAYYNGFSNEALWPLMHYRLDLMRFSPEHLAGYRKINRLFARRVRELLRPDDLIWVHDYHLIPLGRSLRELGVKQPIGFFLHTPFPPRQIAAALPQHRELFRDMGTIWSASRRRATSTATSTTSAPSWAAICRPTVPISRKAASVAPRSFRSASTSTTSSAWRRNPRPARG
jgi:trehalose 6-phosphate synthase